MSFFGRPEWPLAVALAIGLVVGVEREQRRSVSGGPLTAGVRTFTLAALLGGVLAHLGSGWLVVAGLVVLAAIVGVAYALGDRSDPGITTELALLVTYALGALAQREPLLALALGVSVSFLLALRAPLHRVINEVLSPRELLDALTLAVAAVVVLPLVPNAPVDPWGVLNPFVFWRLAVILMAIMSAGYVAMRWVGPRYGLFVAGLAAGFVSSSATIGSMGARAKESPESTRAAVAGAAASTIATFVQLGILVGTANPLLARECLPTLAAAGVVAAIVGFVLALRASRGQTIQLPAGRAFRWQTALVFVGLVALVILGAALLQRSLGDAGVFLGAGLAALADVHAAGSAVAAMTGAGGLSLADAHTALLVAISANTITKALFAVGSGPRAFFVPVWIGLTLVLAAAWAGWVWVGLVGPL